MDNNPPYNASLNAVSAYLDGKVIAYPTEAVFGLGCDPDNIKAIKNLLSLKKRCATKGLILLASDFSQLKPYVDTSSFTDELLSDILARWPDGITQVMPANKSISAYLTGKFETIAVRITSQPDVVALCNAVNKPIISTSANLSGDEEAKTWQQVSEKLGEHVDYIIQGETLGFTQPSKIMNAITGEVYRP